MTYLNLKRGGDKSMSLKREVSEIVYGMDSQRLYNMAKAIL